MKFRMSVQMGHVGSKTRPLDKNLEKPWYAVEATFSVQNLFRLFVLIKSLTILKMGHFGSKSRSVGQTLGKPCVRSRGHIFSLIIMKLGQNVCLNKNLYEFENGSCRVKN